MLFKDIRDALLHLAFPHVCHGCGNDNLPLHAFLCLRCLSSLPLTNYHLFPDNPVEKIFWGRLNITSATAQYYFTKESLIQRLMHQFKYKGNKDLGMFLGILMGKSLAQTPRFSSVDALVPLPLFPSREKKRGYNQAAILCEGMSSEMDKPVLKDIVVRTMPTETQTRKGRIERWSNMQGKFELVKPEKIEGKHILLVDDVVTTGASLEACGRSILSSPHRKLSLATLCFSAH